MGEWEMEGTEGMLRPRDINSKREELKRETLAQGQEREEGCSSRRGVSTEGKKAAHGNGAGKKGRRSASAQRGCSAWRELK